MWKFHKYYPKRAAKNEKMMPNRSIFDIWRPNQVKKGCLKEVSPQPPRLGAVSIRKTVLPGMAIPMLKIRRPNGRLIFNMEIAIRR